MRAPGDDFEVILKSSKCVRLCVYTWFVRASAFERELFPACRGMPRPVRAGAELRQDFFVGKMSGPDTAETWWGTSGPAGPGLRASCVRAGFIVRAAKAARCADGRSCGKRKMKNRFRMSGDRSAAVFATVRTGFWCRAEVRKRAGITGGGTPWAR